MLVWAFEPRQRAAGLGLDQPEDLAGVLDDPSRPSGEKQKATLELPHLAPGPHFPQPARSRNYFPSGLSRLRSLRRWAAWSPWHRPGGSRSSRPPFRRLPVASHWRSGLIVIRAVIQRPDRDRPSASATLASVSRDGDDLSRSILGDRPSTPGRASLVARRSLATRQIDIMAIAGALPTIGEQVPRRFEHAMPGPHRQQGELRAPRQVPENRPPIRSDCQYYAIR